MCIEKEVSLAGGSDEIIDTVGHLRNHLAQFPDDMQVIIDADGDTGPIRVGHIRKWDEHNEETPLGIFV